MKAVILDTGCANLASLAFAVKRLGVEPLITREAAAMTALTERGLPELIREAHQPLLGICLGEQLLGRRSEETGGVGLLGLIDADVRQLNAPGLPLPHMGWNRVFPKFESPQAKLLFKNIEPGEWFYFVHSFAMPDDPERSGKAGARLLANFLGAAA